VRGAVAQCALGYRTRLPATAPKSRRVSSIIRNVVANWSNSIVHFEGEISAVTKQLPVGSYTINIVSTQYPADIAKLIFTIFPGSR
jgi:hypothetical protein